MLKRVYVWSTLGDDAVPLKLEIPENFPLSDDWDQRRLIYDRDRKDHVRRVGNETVGLFMMQKANLISRDVRTKIQRMVHRPLTWAEARKPVEEYDIEFPRRRFIFALALRLLAFSPVLFRPKEKPSLQGCSGSICSRGFPGPKGPRGPPGYPGPPGLCFDSRSPDKEEDGGKHDKDRVEHQ